MDSDLISGETQLHLYNAYHKSAISILTDGIKWRFYLPSAGGEFEDKLFNEINLLEDDPDDAVQAFEMILKKDNYRKKALDTAENMRDELVRIKMIHSVKQEALSMHAKTDLSPFMFAQQLLKKNNKIEIDLEDIERLWDRKQSGIKHRAPAPKMANKSISIRTEPLKDYSFTKARYIILGGSERIETLHWYEVKKAVYNYLIKHIPGFHIEGSFKISKNKSDFRSPLILNDGYFTESNLGSSDMVRHSRAALQTAGLDPINDLVIAYEFTEKRNV